MNKSEEIKTKVVDEITTNALEIVQSPFGNYAIQHIFEVKINILKFI
jgi:hypothetical protein